MKMTLKEAVLKILKENDIDVAARTDTMPPTDEEVATKIAKKSIVENIMMAGPRYYFDSSSKL